MCVCACVCDYMMSTSYYYYTYFIDFIHILYIKEEENRKVENVIRFPRVETTVYY